MTGSLTQSYSRMDRLLHRLAFSGVELQKALADIEDRMHSARLNAASIAKPVFVTSLPRAGTTLLLDVIAKLPGFASHTYRSMPFVLCPMLWESISQGFRVASTAKERAHGDGVSVGYDSPEAFEEVIWKAFWPKKYAADGIALWSADDRNTEFEDFFRSHMRKLIVLAAGKDAPRGRYVSKNNANIARLPLIRALFPDAAILVPFRDPLDQAGSLLRQHLRFIDIQRDDAFARWYMEAIGHYEFGAGFRPIRFPAVPKASIVSDPLKVDFWLAEWIDAYSAIAATRSIGLSLIDFDRVCSEPLPALTKIAETLEMGDANPLTEAAKRFHPSVRYDEKTLGADPTLAAQARALHETLRAEAIR